MHALSTKLWCYLTLMAACRLSVCQGKTQDTVTGVSSSAAQDQDRSFYLGRPVNNPEALSGVWEAPDGHGGAVGLHFVLFTTAPVGSTTLVGTQQSWLHLQVGLYERSGDQIQFGEQNYFSDSPRGGGVRYDHGRLTLHDGEFDLDLKRIADNKWSGRFHLKGFDSEVTLARPGVRQSTKKAWLVGTWRLAQGPGETCLHILETEQGKFMGWSDTLLAWGSAHIEPTAIGPPYSLEHYGELVKVRSVQDGEATIELPASSAMCCSHTFTANRVGHGTAMNANWAAGPNQAPHSGEWKKMSGDSCISSVP